MNTHNIQYSVNGRNNQI